MYTIMCDDKVLHDLRYGDLTVKDPKLDIGLNKAGTLTFDIYSSHEHIEFLEKLKSIITVYRDDRVLWKGRVIETTRNFDTSISVECEGLLSYLCDSVQRPFTFTGGVQAFLNYLLTKHNEQMDDDKKIQLGVCLVTAPEGNIYRYDDAYPTTWDCIQSKLLDSLGGYITVRYGTNGGMTLDYRKNAGSTSAQEIKFSENLIDVMQTVGGSDTASVIIPLGATLDTTNSQDNHLQDRVTIKSVNNGYDYLRNLVALGQHGSIWKTVEFPDITEPEKLLTAAREYLDNVINLTASLEVTAIDLNLTDSRIEAFNIGDNIHIESEPHGLDKTLLLHDLEIDMTNPQNTVVKLGDDFSTFADLIKRNNNIAKEKMNALSVDMNSVKEDLTPLKNLLSVEIDTNAVMIPCDPKGFPLTALDFTVATSGTKGGETTAAYELSLTGVYAGISCLINTTEKTLTFSVLPTGSIAETNLYVLTFTDNETGQKIHKRITVCGVRKGPEGNSGADGQDGKDGQDGAPGKDGNDGQDGVSTYIYVRYSPSSSGDPMSEYPTLNTKYIGVATTTSPDPPEYNNSYTWSKYVGDDAPAMYTWIRYADNAQGLNMSDSPAGKRYIGIAINQTSPTESNDPVLYSWSLIKGDTGADATAYWLVVSAAAIRMNSSGQFLPASITLAGKCQSGTEEPGNYSGRYIIEYTTDGIAWNQAYTSSQDEATVDYNIAGSIKALRCSMYYAGGTSLLLDQKIIPIVSDGVQGATGATGASTYMYVRYSPNADGSGMTSVPAADTKYIGICTTLLSSPPATAAAYIWSEFTRKEDITASFIREALNADSEQHLTHYVLDATALSIYGAALKMYSSADGKEIFGVDNNGCLVLSNPFNNQQLKLTSEGLELVLANENASDTKVAYFSTNEFRIRDGVIEKSLRLGSYIFNPRSNGNLSLEWRE